MKLKNKDTTVMSLNLDIANKTSITLAPRETSRDLTPDELQSPEVQNAIRKRRAILVN